MRGFRLMFVSYLSLNYIFLRPKTTGSKEALKEIFPLKRIYDVFFAFSFFKLIELLCFDMSVLSYQEQFTV